jgi:tetratricopeptide (TPR) repeat protein
MLKLSQMAPHEWEFVYPDIYHQLMEEFNKGCESYEEGDNDEAERIFRAVLAQMPDHIDAIHHLAMVLSERNLSSQARDLWEQAVRIGHKAFPQNFKVNSDILEWGCLDNRPFLRCLHGLALVRYKEGKTEEALKLFQDLLSLNPNDNQGIRAIVIALLFKLGRFEDALGITEHYPDDIMPETLYGRALALFKLGQRKKATAALKKAIRHSPLIGKELLKTRHRLPGTATPDMITVGGADEAYYYWEDSGSFWEQDADTLEWLRKIMEQTIRARQGRNPK